MTVKVWSKPDASELIKLNVPKRYLTDKRLTKRVLNGPYEYFKDEKMRITSRKGPPTSSRHTLCSYLPDKAIFVKS